MATDTQAPHEGLIGSLHRLGETVLHVLATRLDILATEIGEERLNLTKLALVALTVLFCLQVGLILGVLFFVLAVSSQNRLAAIGIASIVMLIGAGAGTLWLRSWLKRRPPMFATTIDELRKDRERLRRKP